MILDDIVKATKIRLEKLTAEASLDSVKEKALKLPITDDFPFKKALAKEGLSLICEVKKASPSKGIIAEDFPYLDIAAEYQKAGADAVSVLTEPDFFRGDSNYLKEISEKISLPCIRKDFVISEYQIYEAKILGAAAILLICAILTDEELKRYLDLAHSLGLSALVEAHDKEEAERALRTGAEIIGVNNRDLKTFEVSLSRTEELFKYIPKDKIKVSESGIHTEKDIELVKNCGADAVLIGEAFMRSENKQDLMKRFKL
ncbi:MAG: indole-3-glycerol phosphate synthase TrpC [Firmicutes bacterium]|nr:indole-3-glycerol phosphate synthase TrpC [[Eubacterium] siraeum]MCM1487648.1 indole-3-glycerol phosphate synthase TrpC [Bacillota bacterium]